MKRPITLGIAATIAVAGVLPVAAGAAAKAGQKCTKVGEVKDTLTCTQVGTKRVFKAAAAPATAAPTTAAAAAASGATPTTAAASAAKPAGLQNAPGFDGKTITIGYLGNVTVNDQFPASKNYADGGKALTAGFNAYIDRVNSAGGVAGKYKIKSLFKETYYTPSEVVKAYTEVKNNVVMLGQVYGTPGMQALQKPIADDGIVASPISLDAGWVKDPNILIVGGTYQAQVINVLDWAVKEGGQAGKTFCSLSFVNNPYGDAGEEGFKYAAKAMNLKVGGVFKTSTAPAQAQALKDAKCDVVAATISGEAQLPPLLLETSKLDYYPMIVGPSPSFASRSVIPSNSVQFSKQVFIAADGSQWGDESVPGMKKHMADLRRVAPEQIGNPNPATEWGYAQAKAVVALLSKAVEMGDLSHAGVKNALANLGVVDQEGMYPTINYVAAAKRKTSSANFIYGVDISTPGGLKLIKPWESAAAQAFSASL